MMFSDRERERTSDQPGETTPAVSLRRVRKTYGSGQTTVAALADVGLDIPAGRFTAVMGPSGSGKSTLLHCAAGLERPDSGEVVVAGVDITPMSDDELTVFRRDRMGFVFQAFNLLPSLTVAQNVQLPLRLAGRRPKHADVQDVLAAVGLADRTGHRPSELSGGQQQRVAIARALICRPAVLFADEPTGSLDSTTGREVLALLRGLVDQASRTVVMVTHDPVAASYADHVVFLADGRRVGELSSPTPDAVAAAMTRFELAR